MSNPTSHRLPLSLPNILLVGVSLAGAIVTGVFGNVLATILLALLGLGGLFSAILARRPNASDSLRVMAFEFADERDSLLASRGFAVVGGAALIATMLELIAALIFFGIGRPTLTSTSFVVFAAAQVFVINVVWYWGIRQSVRRG